MEPTQTTEQIVSTPNSNTKKLAVLVLILAIILGVLLMQKTKNEAPERVQNNKVAAPLTAAQKESKQFTDDINSATSFNNESSLKEIDKEFK